MVLHFPVLNNPSKLCDTRNFLSNAAGTYLFLNERDSDIAISVDWEGENWHLPAHRLVLASMSDVFRRMFDVDMAERKCGKIIITDSRPLTVKQFLKYLYTGTLDFNGWAEAVELLKISHKYNVQTLVALCEAYLSTFVTLSNACYLYEISQTYSLEHLEKQASDLTLDGGFLITPTDGFLNLKPRSLEFFLKSTQLNMENECCVLTTLREWATVRCSRRGLPLTQENVLNEMEPFLKHIQWLFVPEELRTFIPQEIVDKYAGQIGRPRKSFHVAASLQCHMNILKFIVELGSFYEVKQSDILGLNCLKFGVDNHAFVAGFKMVGMFKRDSLPNPDRSHLTLRRDENKCVAVFNLSSLPWIKGSRVGDFVWRELTAYLPYPVRVDPFGTYVITLETNSRGSSKSVRWPTTRLESGVMNSSLGTINFHCCSECYGITQLFMLPAPPSRNICNGVD